MPQFHRCQNISKKYGTHMQTISVVGIVSAILHTKYHGLHVRKRRAKRRRISKGRQAFSARAPGSARCGAGGETMKLANGAATAPVLGSQFRRLATPSPSAASGAVRMAKHFRGVRWIRSCSESPRPETGDNSAGYWSPQVEWNRSRPADTTTLAQLQDYLPESEP